MVRDIDHLTARTFDVLVVGGGIYGLTIAYDASQRGLSVALIEADDFGSAASFNHLRTIHGGLRYLQALNIARARESVRERRTLARIAPHAVRPQLFALPLRRSLARGKTATRVGFALDRLLAADRNLRSGSAASFNHLRTIHGGLRYLQALNIARARESVRERRTLARIAPHAVRPQLFALPLRRSLARGKTATRVGFALDRLLAADRNL